MDINLKIKKNLLENKEDKCHKYRLPLRLKWTKLQLWICFPLNRLKGQASRLWQIQSHFWAISPFLFKGNFLWMFPIQLKTTGTASGTSDLLFSLHTKGKSMHLYTIISLNLPNVQIYSWSYMFPIDSANLSLNL